MCPSWPTREWLSDAVHDSVGELMERDREILGSTERVVVGRLMIYLHKRVQDLERMGWMLDQEYQRFEYRVKTLVGPRKRKFTPDLILHRRRDRRGNLLVIEVKTAKRKSRRPHDFAKLSVLTGHANYAEARQDGLRLPKDPVPAEQAHGENFRLPERFVPYKHGLWLFISPDEASTEFWWLSDPVEGCEWLAR